MPRVKQAVCDRVLQAPGCRLPLCRASLEGRRSFAPIKVKEIFKRAINSLQNKSLGQARIKPNHCTVCQEQIYALHLSAASRLASRPQRLLRCEAAEVHTQTQADLCSQADFFPARQMSPGLWLHRGDSVHYHHKEPLSPAMCKSKVGGQHR